MYDMYARDIADSVLCSERLVKEPVQGISATPHDDNLRYFDVTIDGPSQSPYEGKQYAHDYPPDQG